jgi:hypothetical protein
MLQIQLSSMATAAAATRVSAATTGVSAATT